jgi:DNA-binding response OmpR family regulator
MTAVVTQRVGTRETVSAKATSVGQMGRAATAAGVAAEPRKARVLIADDDADIRALVAVAVRKAGHETVGVVSNGKRALAEALASLPDLVILDVSMPLMSGLDVCAELRADPRTEGMRIVLLSAGAHDRAITAGLAAGADRYVSKPFSPSALVDLVTDMVGCAR